VSWNGASRAASSSSRSRSSSGGHKEIAEQAPVTEGETEATGRAQEGAGPAPSPRIGRAGYWWFAAALVLMYALLAGAPFIRGIPVAVGSIAVTVLFILSAMTASVGMAVTRLSWLNEAVGMLLCLGIWYVLAGIAEGDDFSRAVLLPAADIVFLVACVLAGRLLSRILKERNILLPVALVLALADVFTVFLGPTAAVLANAPEVVKKLSVKLPQLGSATGPEGVAGLMHLATMGPGDLVFLSLFFVTAARFGLSLRGTFAGIFALVAVGLGIFVVVPGVPAVPVLPLMAVGFLIANRGEFRLTAAERRNLMIAAAFFGVLLLAIWALTKLVY